MACVCNKLLFFLGISYLSKALELEQRTDDVTTKKENVTRREDVTREENVTTRYISRSSKWKR
jgi:hypothetical protein